MLSLSKADLNLVKESILSLKLLSNQLRGVKKCLEPNLIQQSDQSLYIKQIPHVAYCQSLGFI